jgi:hypothetical protein
VRRKTKPSKAAKERRLDEAVLIGADGGVMMPGGVPRRQRHGFDVVDMLEQDSHRLVEGVGRVPPGFHPVAAGDEADDMPSTNIVNLDALIRRADLAAPGEAAEA